MDEIQNIKRKIFCQTLKSMRRGHHLTQKQVAKKLGVTQSYISKIERDNRGIDVLELMDYCHAAGISLTEFAARLEWKLAKEFSKDTVQMKFYLSVLQSFNLT